MAAHWVVGLAGLKAVHWVSHWVEQWAALMAALRADYWAVLKAERTAVQKGKPTVGK